MTTVDYFLYDNQTWSAQTGRDWGIKASTGALASRIDLKTDFLRYCSAMPADQGKLAAFGEALGGIRSRTGKGYLLCVTLESSDSFGRPSWAVYGLWCPDARTLQDLLLANPVGAARGALGLPSPPSAIHVQTGAATVRPVRRTSAGITFHRFETAETIKEVIAILSGSLRRNAALPNILGITGSARLSSLANAGFDRVYCHVMDEPAGRALARHLSGPDLQEVEPPSIAIPTRPAAPTYAPATAQSRYGRRLPLAAAVVAFIAAALFIFVTGDDDGAWQVIETEKDDTLQAAGSSDNQRASRPMPGPAVLLDDLHRSLEEFRNLDPGSLRKSRGFDIASNMAVLARRHGDERKRVQDAYETLFEVRERMIGPRETYVAYYFDELPAGAHTPSAAERLAKIQHILEETPLGGDACTTLKNAFGFEFENGNSAVRRWCDASIRLETRARHARAAATPPTSAIAK